MEYDQRKISGFIPAGFEICIFPTKYWGLLFIVCNQYNYAQSKNKGTIDKLPEIPGLILYSKTHPHVGVYIGNGWTIECTLGSRGDGVVKRKLDKFWEYWFECPFITYTKPSKPKKLTVGSKVKIKTTATTYAGSGSIKIPAWVKGNIYTVSQLNGTMSLLKEINSWVKNDDLEIQ